MSFAYLVLAFSIGSGAHAAVGRHSQSAHASRDINEFETLNEENLISEEGYRQFQGCVATRAFTRGSLITPEHIACLGSRG